MEASYDNRGMPHADNETNFKQNLIRTSKTEELGMLEELRHVEMTNSFISDSEAEYCIRTLEVAQNNIEIHFEIIGRYMDHIIDLNKARRQDGRRLISVEKEFKKYKAACLMPTIQRDVSRVKNICQIAKSRGGIAVKTLTTHQVVNLNRQDDYIHEEQQKSIFGFMQPKKKEEVKPMERGSNPYG